MKKIILSVVILYSANCFAQKEETAEESPALKTATDNACKCISKISILKKSQEDIAKDISTCIEKEVNTYELSNQIMDISKLLGSKNSDTIYMSDSKKHSKSYFEIESSLRDNCSVLGEALNANNKESKNSMSTDKTALKYYKKGITAMESEQYNDAADYFQKALDADNNFAFAWDNLGISLRRTGKYKEAIAAYKASLALDPKGETPLMNLPVVYKLMKDYDKALEGYAKMTEVHPDNPEGYFGAGQIYLEDAKKDYEKALDLMCKAYVIYIKMGSPYRSDTEKIIGYIYSEMKKEGKEERFNAILKDNNINH